MRNFISGDKLRTKIVGRDKHYGDSGFVYYTHHLFVPRCTGVNLAVVPYLQLANILQCFKVGGQPVLPPLIFVDIANKHPFFEPSPGHRRSTGLRRRRCWCSYEVGLSTLRLQFLVDGFSQFGRKRGSLGQESMNGLLLIEGPIDQVLELSPPPVWRTMIPPLREIQKLLLEGRSQPRECQRGEIRSFQERQPGFHGRGGRSARSLENGRKQDVSDRPEVTPSLARGVRGTGDRLKLFAEPRESEIESHLLTELQKRAEPGRCLRCETPRLVEQAQHRAADGERRRMGGTCLSQQADNEGFRILARSNIDAEVRVSTTQALPQPALDPALPHPLEAGGVEAGVFSDEWLKYGLAHKGTLPTQRSGVSTIVTGTLSCTISGCAG